MGKQMKRFTDTEKWGDEWFRELPPVFKCLWVYLCDRCDNAGIWKVDKGLAEFQIGSKIDWENAIESFGERCVFIKEDRIFITGFIAFQYGELKENSKPHAQVLRILELNNVSYPKHTLSIPYTKGMDTLMDKDKDKDKDILKEGGCKGETKTDFEIAFDNFKIMRKLIKKPLTKRAEELIYMKLERLSEGDESVKIKILEQSIEHSWQGVFPLKEFNNGKSYRSIQPVNRARNQYDNVK